MVDIDMMEILNKRSIPYQVAPFCILLFFLISFIFIVSIYEKRSDETCTFGCWFEKCVRFNVSNQEQHLSSFHSCRERER
jgi:hypothetical protein